MPEAKTDQALIDALTEAAKRPLTTEEIRKQRVSFILGSLGNDSTITKEQVETVLNKLEGRAA